MKSKARWLLPPVFALAACGLPENSGVSGLNIPDRASFPLVADAMQPSCGTLDCHGQRGRNLRLYGGRGLRLDPHGSSADEPTTEAEYQASFRSLIGLEPEALDAVIWSGGMDPERLSLIRKARGTERHRGGVQMLPGDPLDRCLTSWLSSLLSAAACARVASTPRPAIEAP
jgi:hypothetical protein